ncbi:MAG: fibronectin type III domain-containing protein [Candidatus Heimdallarchaeota archaeon]|nr:fibronectin type III domain-containing protein [Candidatus Heimdallarchaeota archaeon]
MTIQIMGLSVNASVNNVDNIREDQTDNQPSDYYTTVTDRTDTVTGFEKMETMDLPDVEKNRINSTSKNWFYKDRGLEMAPAGILVNTSLIEVGKWDYIYFGVLDGMTVNIKLYVNAYVDTLNNIYEANYSNSDLDLFLYEPESSLPLQTSTRERNEDEEIEYTFDEEGNYSIGILHDLRDTYTNLSMGVVELQATFSSYNFMSKVYLEGRTPDNYPTNRSSWYYSTGDQLNYVGAIVDNDIDMYVVNASYEDISIWEGAPSLGFDIELFNGINPNTGAVNIKYEAEWGLGYAFLYATSEPESRLLTSQLVYPKLIDKKDIKIEFAAVGISYGEEYLIDGSSNAGIYSMPLDLYESIFPAEFETIDVNSENYPIPKVDNSGFTFKTNLNYTGLYFKIHDLSGANANLTLIYHDEGKEYQTPLTWIMDDYYSCSINPKDISSVEWFIEIEQIHFKGGYNVPDKPTNSEVKFDFVLDKATLSWDVPESDLAIQKFFLYSQYNSEDEYELIDEVNALTTNYKFDIPDNDNGATYFSFAVSAFSYSGESDWAINTYQFDKPTSPPLGNVTWYEDQLNISWSEPVDVGNDPIIWYSIYYSDEYVEDATVDDLTLVKHVNPDVFFYYVDVLNYYYITAVNHFGLSPFSVINSTAAIQTIADQTNPTTADQNTQPGGGTQTQDTPISMLPFLITIPILVTIRRKSLLAK